MTTYRIQQDEIEPVEVNVAAFLRGRTDIEAFEAAIASFPDGARGQIVVPDIGRPWNLSRYLQYGNRRVTIRVDDGVSFGADSNWAKLNTKVVLPNGVFMPGFANRDDACAMTVISGGGGALTGRRAAISGFDTVQEQAYTWERGRASMYIAATGIPRKVPSATFAADRFTPTTPIDPNPLRVGMFVDVPGTVVYASAATARFTSRITGWEPDGSVVYVEGWWRRSGATSAVQETPPNGRPVTINPTNKIWGANINVFCNETEGDTYGHQSGSCLELGFLNATGAATRSYFDVDTMPFHFYGVDMAQLGDNADQAGGVAFMARGNAAPWWQAYCNRGAEIGFHNEGTAANNARLGFVSTYDDVEGGATAFLARRRNSAGEYRRMVAISGSQPIINLGSDAGASAPEVRFHSSGNNLSYDARITVQNGTSTVGKGQMTVTANRLVVSAFLSCSLPVYADNAAAVSGGLPVGDFYRTASGEVRVRI